jgi:hypothetical protein
MTYEVYAVKYAHHARRASGNFIGGDPHDGPMPLDYFVWLVRGHGRELVVDTGFSAAMAAKRGRQHHLQELEMRYATGRYMCQECFSGAFEAEDVVGMVRRASTKGACSSTTAMRSSCRGCRCTSSAAIPWGSR